VVEVVAGRRAKGPKPSAEFAAKDAAAHRVTKDCPEQTQPLPLTSGHYYAASCGRSVPDVRETAGVSGGDVFVAVTVAVSDRGGRDSAELRQKVKTFAVELATSTFQTVQSGGWGRRVDRCRGAVGSSRIWRSPLRLTTRRCR